MLLNRLQQVGGAAIVQKIRWPNPHSGAERNSSPRADPCTILSASRLPMWCTARSEKSSVVWLLNPPNDDCPVINKGVWHKAQPVVLNCASPFAVDGVEGPRVGGAKNLMKAAIDRKLGAAKIATRTTWNQTHLPSGTFVTLVFKMQFEKGDGTETFMYRISDGKAFLAGYHINSNALITR